MNDSVFKYKTHCTPITGVHCDYCGSMSPKQAITLLQAPGTEFSGSDWKYGWPHKFYIHNKSLSITFGKFYSNHINEMDENDLNVWNSLSRRIFGIAWQRDIDNRLKWAVIGKQHFDDFYGYQQYGRIDEDGNPIFESQ
jgi:hypothetical protein